MPLTILRPHEQVDRRALRRALQRLRGYPHPRQTNPDGGDALVDTFDTRAEHIAVADEGGDEPVDRPAVDLVGSSELANAALRHHRDPVGETQGLALVMGDKDSRHAELAQNLL